MQKINLDKISLIVTGYYLCEEPSKNKDIVVLM